MKKQKIKRVNKIQQVTEIVNGIRMVNKLRKTAMLMLLLLCIPIVTPTTHHVKVLGWNDRYKKLTINIIEEMPQEYLVNVKQIRLIKYRANFPCAWVYPFGDVIYIRKNCDDLKDDENLRDNLIFSISHEVAHTYLWDKFDYCIVTTGQKCWHTKLFWETYNNITGTFGIFEINTNEEEIK